MLSVVWFSISVVDDFVFCSTPSSSGICVCKTGVYGPKCDECHPGFFHFSSTGCRPCQCHNRTNYCHPQSGESAEDTEMLAVDYFAHLKWKTIVCHALVTLLTICCLNIWHFPKHIFLKHFPANKLSQISVRKTHIHQTDQFYSFRYSEGVYEWHMNKPLGSRIYRTFYS